MSLHPVAEANEESPFGSLTPEEFYARHKVTHGTEFITNSRGLKLFTQWWIPLPDSVKPLFVVVCVVHGFTCESSWFMQLTSVHLAKQGFAVCTIDHQGHGFSEGLQAHIPDINPVVDDCVAFFDDFRYLGGRGAVKEEEESSGHRYIWVKIRMICPFCPSKISSVTGSVKNSHGKANGDKR